jgi:thiamine-phosphate pyrophosphorylase
VESRSGAESGVTRPPQRLYLVTPPLDDTASFARQLEAALAAADIAAVLLRLAQSDERTLINRAKATAAVVQRRDVALLLDGHPEIVARVGADGAHLTGIEAFVAALALLKPDRIAGSGGLRSRHDAMLAAETGADYVMFGEPPPPFPPPRAGGGEGGGPRAGEGKGGGRLPFDELLDRLTWWAELFEIPCIGYAANLDEVGALARTGADFVALGDWIWTHPQGAAAGVAAAAENLA